MLSSIDELHNEIEILKGNNIDTDELVRISEAIEHEMQEGYVELPKDAYGLPIHVGDRLYGWALEGKPVITVHHIALYEDGWRISDSPAHEATPNLYRYYKPLTIEDVLRELVDEYELARGYVPDVNEVLAKFAERLQLKEEQ